MTEAIAALPDDQVAAILADLASGDAGCGCKRELLPLLREDASIYRGRGTSETERLRAYVMVALAKAGLGDVLIPYVIEELETGTGPYPVAAAARVARSAVPAQTVPLLVAAIERIRPVDEFVHLDTYPAPPGVGPTTAIGEVVKTLAVAGPAGLSAIRALADRAADGFFSRGVVALLQATLEERKPPGACCGQLADAAAAEPQPIARSIAGLNHIELQNQDGIRTSFGRMFGRRTSLIVFFYTRCMNPDKCSRSISKLAQVHDLMGQQMTDSTAMVAAITYDPEYDLPERLRRYGADRGLPFGERCQLLRSTGSFAAIRDSLQLGVGYGSSTVNRHRIELIIVDSAGMIVDFHVRRLWDEHEVADALVAVDTRQVRAAALG
jgi:cytochrome oxidase Cu insertion factor (SCO1/SenC/PrrC family)